MRYSIFIFTGLLSILLIACSPRVRTSLSKTYPSFNMQQEVLVIALTEEAPASAIEIGIVKIGDTGFSTDCGWNTVIERAKMEARKAGGNVIKIIKHTPPSMMGSTCDKITAKILRIEDSETLAKVKNAKPSLVDSTWNYAKLYVYRPGGTGVLVNYDLHLGDSVICRVKNDSKQEIKITKKGMNVLWAKTEAKSEVKINIEYGREYYLKCSIGMGILIGRPALEIIDNTEGKIEYNEQ